MDPVQALADLLDACSDANGGAISPEGIDACEALLGWLKSGGFSPDPAEAIERAGWELSGNDT